MQGKDYRALAGELNKEGMFKPRASYGALTVLGELALFGGAFAALLHVALWSPAFFALEAFLGLSLFRFFVIVHECGHRSLFQSRLACNIAGTIASVFCLVPFVPWRNIHMLHHKWVGVIDKDPTQKALLRLRSYGPGMNFLFRLIWKLWLPVMYLTFIADLFWGYPFRQLLQKDGDRKQALRGFASLVAILVPRIAIVYALGPARAAVLLLPMFYVFLFVDENVSLPQHTGLFPFLSKHRPNPIPFHEQDAVTRTTNGANLLSVLLAYNFTLHTEHHLFPSVPWYWLPRVTARVEAMRSYTRVNFAKYMVSIRLQDPVVVYTKALPSEVAPPRASPHPPADHDEDAPESVPLPAP